MFQVTPKDHDIIYKCCLNKTPHSDNVCDLLLLFRSRKPCSTYRPQAPHLHSSPPPASNVPLGLQPYDGVSTQCKRSRGPPAPDPKSLSDSDPAQPWGVPRRPGGSRTGGSSPPGHQLQLPTRHRHHSQ